MESTDLQSPQRASRAAPLRPDCVHAVSKPGCRPAFTCTPTGINRHRQPTRCPPPSPGSRCGAVPHSSACRVLAICSHHPRTAAPHSLTAVH